MAQFRSKKFNNLKSPHSPTLHPLCGGQESPQRANDAASGKNMHAIIIAGVTTSTQPHPVDELNTATTSDPPGQKSTFPHIGSLLLTWEERN